MASKALLVSVVLAVAGIAFAQGARAQSSGGEDALPSPTRGNSLAQCVETLNAQGGGWCELGQPMSTIWPFRPGAAMTRRDPRHCVVGPKAILIAWNGMAIDKEARKLYFVANGGHADYCGNGAYEFDLASGKWTRLLDPAPLSRTWCLDDPACQGTRGPPPYGGASGAPVRIPAVKDGPASSHTYDGVQFSRKTRTIFLRPDIYGNPGPEFYSGGEFWELNPSRDETRNGLAPLAWRLHRRPDGAILKAPGKTATSAELGDGDLLLGGGGHMRRLDPEDPAGTLTAASVTSPGADYGGGSTLYDPFRDVVWFFADYPGRLFRLGLDRTVTDLGQPCAGAGTNGIAMRAGNIIFWNGRALIHEYDPDTGGCLTWDWTGKRPGRGDTRVYSKWSYLPDLDVFVGLTDETNGVLVYKHPQDGGTGISAASAQGFIDAAPPGGTATIPTGVYGEGIRIARPLTVKMEGVRFMRPVGGRGVVWVDNANGPVVLDGFTADTPPACGGNCAGVRVQGPAYDVTLRNATILNQEMGVLTDNRGGRLVIEDSVIGETGDGSDLSHIVYAGWSGELVIRRSTIRDSWRNGHLVKSRAAVTVIEDSRILGNESRHSRLVEIPCGGTLTIRNTEIRQSENTDNAEMMLVGGATPANCAGNANRPGKLVFEGGSIRSDRDYSADERARNYGPTAIVKWRAPNEPDVTLGGVALERVDILAYWPDLTHVPLPPAP